MQCRNSPIPGTTGTLSLPVPQTLTNGSIRSGLNRQKRDMGCVRELCGGEIAMEEHMGLDWAALSLGSSQDEARA